MSNIIPFVFDEQAIRTTADEHGDSWFFAVDVCAALGIANARDALIKLDDDEKSQVIDPDTVGLTDGTGINNLVGVVNESGLYTLILRCRNATKAGTAPHRFRKWVTSEVLPALRKTGRYALPAEPTISPAQQRQLQNAIAARFPDGKKRPYAWSRFGNHFSLGSYKQLPASKTDEALVYIAQMPGGADETERERLAREVLQVARLLLSFDRNGMLHLQEIPADAYVVTDEDLPRIIGDANSLYPRDRLPGLIQAAASRLM